MTLKHLAPLLGAGALAAVLAAGALAQDPTGRDIPKEKKPPVKTPRKPAPRRTAPVGARLNIIAPQGAMIELSGQPRSMIGSTGQYTYLAIAPGAYELNVHLDGYEPWSGTVTVEAPSTNFEVPLRRRVSTTGRLSILCSEPGTEIFIDGRSLGIKSLAGNAISHDGLAPGTHRVRAVKSGFHEWEEKVEVAAGETVKLKVELKPR
jgi:hypothetical protein